MSDTKFTPGPWKINGDAIETDAGLVAASPDYLPDDWPRYEWSANAHLIAAAPDMYAALQMVDSIITDSHPLFASATHNAVVNALHKATGRIG